MKGQRMKGYVGNTDYDWYQHLLAQPSIDEVNFWKPSGASFKVLSPGDIFFFRLKGKRRAIAGYGIFARFAKLPIWLAWDAFKEKNCVADMGELLARAARYRGKSRETSPASLLGCIIVTSPVFFPEGHWIPEPDGWSPNIVSGKSYALNQGVGLKLWHDALRADADLNPPHSPSQPVPPGQPDTAVPAVARFGKPQLVAPRLGQGAFRVAVTQAYGEACAVTREHTLPVIEAAHIRPYADDGPHEVDNGLALRSDVHRLFDMGYVTVDPDNKFVVSPRLKEDFDNGLIYYQRHGSSLYLPQHAKDRPAPRHLEWHRQNVYRA